MVDRRRHPSSARRRAVLPDERPRGLPQVYKGRARKTIRDIYDTDHAEAPNTGRFRWLISTCLAAAVGAVAVIVVVYGSADPKENADAFLPALKRIGEGDVPPSQLPEPHRRAGLNWSVPRSDRLQSLTGAVTTRSTIHDSQKQRRAGREYIHAKPYARINARLAPVPSSYSDVIPPFNPLKLYANSQPINTGEDDDSALGRTDVAIRVVELLGGILPEEDGQELATSEVEEIVARAGTDGEPSEISRNGVAGSLYSTIGSDGSAAIAADIIPPNTSILSKPPQDIDDATDDLAGSEVRVVKAARGDTLTKILIRSGADTWQARAMVDAARTIFPEASLVPGQEVHVTVVPSLTVQGKLEPARFSVFADGHDHKVTVARSAAGEFVGSRTPAGIEAAARAVFEENDQPAPTSANLYASLYYAGLLQKIPAETVLKILRIHAYETDFRRRVLGGDSVEFFFDIDEDRGPEAPPGELLYTAITAGGETSRYYRFRTSDGVIDYYDDQGNNSKKFLMRRPVRGNEVRLTSGYGLRFHPLLNERKMHTGVDWAAPPGTPIMAAGNGVIEEAGRKGQYGNYVRIRHANGYHTAYGHMLRFADGARTGAKVRQGDLIGFVGSTGLSSGPHLHFEVLVNTRFVDPLKIEVPRERKLDGRQLADFQKERARIDELRNRAPVLTSSK